MLNAHTKMTPEQFCYWLQGFAELQAAGDFDLMAPDEEQWEMIVAHLQTVFKNVTAKEGTSSITLPKGFGDFGIMKPVDMPPYTGPVTIC
jgi:hypothetical protein